MMETEETLWRTVCAFQKKKKKKKSLQEIKPLLGDWDGCVLFMRGRKICLLYQSRVVELNRGGCVHELGLCVSHLTDPISLKGVCCSIMGPGAVALPASLWISAACCQSC